MGLTDYFALLAILHGCFILGFSVYIFSYYFPKTKMEFKKDKLRWHVIFVAASYCMLTFATVITSIVSVYRWLDPWYFLITTAYVLGDVSLYQIFRHSVYKDKKQKLENNKKDKL